MPLPFVLLAGVAAFSAGCLNIKTAAIEVKPIHITVDVNVKVDQALKNFFGKIDQQAAQP